MRHQNPYVQELVAVVAGAANLDIGPLSTAKPHLGRLTHGLRAGPERVVTSPITPDHLGLYDLDGAYEHFVNDIGDAVDNHPNARVVLVGHSFGGLLARRWAAESAGHNMVAGVITIATPHTGIRDHLPAWLRESYREFANTIPADNETNKAFIATTKDELVPKESALAEVPGAQHFLARLLVPNPLRHNALPVSPGVIRSSSLLVSQMLGVAENSRQLLDEPA